MWYLWIGLAISTATAEPLRADVAGIQAGLASGEIEDGGQRLKLALSAAPYTVTVTDAQTVAELLYYKGLLPRVMGMVRPRDLDHWRDALVVYPDLAWDKAILDDRDQAAVFEALRGEVGQRAAVATGVPEVRGLAVMYVDGVLHSHGQAVRAGQHLVQIRCPDGKVAGRWTRFDTPVPWLSMCRTPVDTSVQPAPVEEEGDPELGTEDDFGMEDEDPRAGPEPLPISLVVIPVPPSFSDRWKTKLLLGAGGSAVVSSGLYIAALVSRARYDDWKEGEIGTQGDLDAQRRRTNTQVGLSLTFATASVGMATVAGLSGRW